MTGRLPVLAAATALAAAALAGCSDGAPAAGPAASAPSAAPSGTTTASAAASASAAPSAATSTTPSGAAPSAASPGPSAAGSDTGQAPPPPDPDFDACRLVGRSAAATALGTDLAAGVPDVRGATEGRTQADGCVYTGAAGAAVGYVAWDLPTVPDRALVRQGLPPAATGARRFDPGVGAVSAGSVLTQGPVTVAQVNAAKRGVLVQVTVVGPDAGAARSAAVAAARTAVRRS